MKPCEHWNCVVQALGRRFTHILDHVKGSPGWRTRLSAYYMHRIWDDVSVNNMRDNLKWAGNMLDYPNKRGIPINRIDTHLLRMRGANALVLSGYSDCQIQKMGRWYGATFK